MSMSKTRSVTNGVIIKALELGIKGFIGLWAFSIALPFVLIPLLVALAFFSSANAEQVFFEKVGAPMSKVEAIRKSISNKDAELYKCSPVRMNKKLQFKVIKKGEQDEE